MKINNLKIKPFSIIFSITVVVVILGSIFTNSGMNWYNTQLILPDLTPPKPVFPIAWSTIYILTMISAIIIWTKKLPLFSFGAKKTLKWIAGLFVTNAVINVLWSLLFFQLHLILPALIDIVLIEVTLFWLFAIMWKYSKIASLLLLPYILWCFVALYLNYSILILN